MAPAPYASATITIIATRTGTEAITNVATVSVPPDGPRDPDPSNNTATVSVAPSQGEDCGNCTDDDGDGLIDGEAVCCAVPQQDWTKVLGRVYWARGLQDTCPPVKSLCLILPKRGPTRTVVNAGAQTLATPLDVTLRVGYQCVRGLTGQATSRGRKGTR